MSEQASILSVAEVAAITERAARAAGDYPNTRDWTVSQRQVVEQTPLLTASHETLRAERDAARQRNDQSQQEWLAMRAERDAALGALVAVRDVAYRMHLSADPYVWEFADALGALPPPPAAPAPDRQP